MNEQRRSLEKNAMIYIIPIHTFGNIYVNEGLKYLQESFLNILIWRHWEKLKNLKKLDLQPRIRDLIIQIIVGAFFIEDYFLKVLDYFRYNINEQIRWRHLSNSQHKRACCAQEPQAIWTYGLSKIANNCFNSYHNLLSKKKLSFSYVLRTF